MKSFELYYFPSCPYCQYVLSELPNTGKQPTLKNIRENMDYRNELMAGGGKTQVPCLRIIEDNGDTWMYESRDIVDYLMSA